MDNGKIRLKKLSDLIQETKTPVAKSNTLKGKCAAASKASSAQVSESDSDFVDTNATPKRAKNQKELRVAPSTSKKTSVQPNTIKKVSKSSKKEPPPSQTRIDSFFKSCSKSFQVSKADFGTSNGKLKVNQTTGGKLQQNKRKNPRNMGRGRKRLFDDTTETDTDATTPSCISGVTPKKPIRKRSVKKGTNKGKEEINLLKKKSSVVECIDLISESEGETCELTNEALETNHQSSVSEIVMHINREENVNTSDSDPTSAVINEISICQTTAIYLGNKPQLPDLKIIQSNSLHLSSEIEEDIGTLIQSNEKQHQQQSVQEDTDLPQADLNNVEALCQAAHSREQQLTSCYTSKPPLADLGTANSGILNESSEIEDIGILIQKSEEENQMHQSASVFNAKNRLEIKESQVIKAELHTVDHKKNQLSPCYTNNSPLRDLGTATVDILNESSEIEDIGTLIQKAFTAEHVLNSQSELSVKYKNEIEDPRDIEIEATEASSRVYISSDEDDSLPPESRTQKNANNLEHSIKPILEDLQPLNRIQDKIIVPEKLITKEGSLAPPMPLPNSSKKSQVPLLCQTTETAVLSATTEEEASTKAVTKKRKPRPCPPYKVVTGTTFGVDAFQFGLINGVTHYFLTHFHADHYIGLTRKFSMPLFCSPITARLLRVFIPLEERFVQEIELNEPQIVEGVEVTAIDANHCPGAVMFVFKLPTGKCILHTGDFRASPNMESEPIFWNNDIHTIYLDTTYISNKYAFCSQDESIDEAQHLIEQFQEKHKDKRILYICGSYLIGKERMWSSIARNNRLLVWTEDRRNKALRAMQDLDYLDLLVANPTSATMHVIPMGKLSYFSLVEYFEQYSRFFDICLAIRPSGWEKNSKPQYRGKINIIGVEYSEHSSHNELQRFVTYLNPQEVISTVPASGNLMITSDVPQAWYKYKKFPTKHRNFQPSITNYLKRKTRNKHSSEQTEESSKENFLPNQLSQSDEFEDVKCSQKVVTDKLSILHAAGDADDDWLS